MKSIYDNIKESMQLIEANDKDALDAVMWMHGFNKKEAKKFIKETDNNTIKEIIKGFKENAKRNFNEGKSLKENVPNYGGAFDIDPHQYFTKEEIVEFAYNVEDELNKNPEVSAYGLHFIDVYIVDYNRLVVDFEDNEGNVYSGQVNIDMRRIRKPSDINKYMNDIVSQIVADVKDLNESMNLTEDSFNHSLGVHTDRDGNISSKSVEEQVLELNKYGDITLEKLVYWLPTSVVKEFLDYAKNLTEEDW